MTQCQKLHRYVDVRLSEADTSLFEKHLEECDTCAESIKTLASIRTQFQHLAKQEETLQPDSPASALHHMVSEVDYGRRRVQIVKPILAWSGAAAFLLVVGLGVLFYFSGDEKKAATPPEVSVGGEKRNSGQQTEALAKELVAGSVITTTTGETAQLELGLDRLGLNEKSHLSVIETTTDSTQLELKSGSIACAVTPRHNRGEFTVLAGEYKVRVVGTRFIVAIDNPETVVVIVKEGAVQVSNGAQRPMTVRTGQRLVGDSTGLMSIKEMSINDEKLLDELLEGRLISITPVAEEAEASHDASVSDTDTANKKTARSTSSTTNDSSASLAAMQRSVLGGNVKEASVDLKKYLLKHPHDAEAWFLLADCKKRMGDYEGAVAAYEKVSRTQKGLVANTAGYRAGILLQDKLHRHSAAIVHFERFLKRAEADFHLRPAAMLRLSRSLRIVGETERAERLLEKINNDFKATPAAQEARQLLGTK